MNPKVLLLQETFKVDDTPMVVHPEKIDFRRFV